MSETLPDGAPHRHRMMKLWGFSLDEADKMMSESVSSPAGKLPPLTSQQPCLVHPRHVPAPHITHIHHVWPRGDGGPDQADNTVVICPTGHFNVHTLIDLYRQRGGDVPYTLLRRYSLGERELAKLGWWRISNKRMR